MRVQAGGVPNQDATLEVQSDAIALIFAEDPSANDTWHLDVWAETKEGRFIVGAVDTTSAVIGGVPSRVIATANCPGAIRWFVQATGPKTPTVTPSGGVADLTLSAARDARFSSSNVFPNRKVRYVTSPPNGDGSGTLAASQVIAAGPVFLAAAWGFNEGAVKAFVQTYDAPAIPADGIFTVPIESIDVPAAGSFSLRLEERQLYTTGLSAVLSTVGVSKTLAAAGARWRFQIESV